MRRLWMRLALAVSPALVLGLVACEPPPPPADPPLSVPLATLNAALTCPATFTSSHQPVLLVHGTFTNPDENWSWNYRVALPRDGYDVCWVTLPERSIADIQVASEYVVQAVRTINARSRRRVDIIGHSQGGLEPRWALRWWPSLLSKVDDLVTLATPNHGTIVADTPGPTCPACWQMRTTSNFVAALNSGDETPATVGAAPSYTALYSLTDELVEPSVPTPTAALNGASNILVQAPDVCPGRPVDHVGFAYDKVVYDLTRDALDHKGPAVPSRAYAASGQVAFCAQTTIVDVPALLALALAENLDFTDAPASSFVSEEPALKCYAGGHC